MAIAFPASPTIGQEYTYKGATYVWSGSIWALRKEALQSATDESLANAAGNFALGMFSLVRWTQTVTLATDGATTTVGLTPGGTIFGASMIVSTAIAGLDSADHHIQLGIAGTVAKYIDVANGASATSIAQNKKGHYGFNPATGVESAALILTITAGADQTPTAGAVDLDIVYAAQADLANVA